MSAGRTVRLFLVDGRPDGIIWAELMNWTGQVLYAPRWKLNELVSRQEVQRTGVYFLLGPDPEDGFLPRLYVGESDDVARRLMEHQGDTPKMDFWEETFLVTSKDDNLTKSHVRYLERELIRIAEEAGRTKRANRQDGYQNATLPEPDRSDMSFFLEQLRMVLPTLKGMFLEQMIEAPSPVAATTVAVTEDDLFELVLERHGVRAEARDVNGRLVVLKGALARGDGSTSWNAYRDLREELKASNKLVAEGGQYVLGVDTIFRSPSAASSVLLDRNDNGRSSWRLKKDPAVSYGAWKAAQSQASAVQTEET